MGGRPSTGAHTLAIAAVLVSAFAGALLVALPLDREGSSVPGAASGQSGLPPPTGPAGNGLIAFARGGDILIDDGSTGGAAPIVSGPDADASPKFSPDGSRIAFVRGDPVAYDARIVVVGVDGSEPRDVTPSGWPLEFAWAPDGSALLVYEEHRERPSIGGVLTLYDVSGVAEPLVLVPPLPFFPGGPYFDASAQVAPMFRPPDGDQILSGDYHALNVFDADLEGPTQLAAEALEPYEPYGPRPRPGRPTGP